MTSSTLERTGAHHADMGGTDRQILWIDDEREQVDRWRPAFESSGYEVLYCSPSDFRPELLSVPVVVLDLRTGDAELDGVVLARKVHAYNPKIAILFASAFLSMPGYSDPEKRICPLANCLRVDKRTLANASDLYYNDGDVNSNLERKQAAARIESIMADLESPLDKTNPPGVVLSSSALEKISRESFKELAPAKKVEMGRAALESSRLFLKSVFSMRSDVDWVVLDFPSGEVIGWGDNEGPASSSEVYDLYRGSSSGVPFVFHRHSTVD